MGKAPEADSLNIKNKQKSQIEWPFGKFLSLSHGARNHPKA
jgi:hypothetical protein